MPINVFTGHYLPAIGKLHRWRPVALRHSRESAFPAPPPRRPRWPPPHWTSAAFWPNSPAPTRESHTAASSGKCRAHPSNVPRPRKKLWRYPRPRCSPLGLRQPRWTCCHFWALDWTNLRQEKWKNKIKKRKFFGFYCIFKIVVFDWLIDWLQ